MGGSNQKILPWARYGYFLEQYHQGYMYVSGCFKNASGALTKNCMRVLEGTYHQSELSINMVVK